MGNEDGHKTNGVQVEVKKAKLQAAILFSIIKNRNNGEEGIGLSKRNIKKVIEVDFPELLEYLNYFEDAIEVLITKKGRNPPYIVRIKGYSYGLNEEIADNIIQDYRVGALLVDLAGKYLVDLADKYKGSFSYGQLKQEYSDNPHFEVLFNELKEKRYIVSDKVLKKDYHFIILNKYKKAKLYLDMIIKGGIMKI